MTSKEISIIGAGALATCVIIWGSMILSTGILMGLLTLISMVILYQRMPVLRKLANRFPAGIDIAAAVLTYVVLGGTVVGMIAAAVVGIGSSMLLNVQLERHEMGRREAFASALS